MSLDHGAPSRPHQVLPSHPRTLRAVQTARAGDVDVGPADPIAELDRAVRESRRRRQGRTVHVGSPPDHRASALLTALVDHAVRTGAAVAVIDSSASEGATSLFACLSAGPAPVLSTSSAGALAAVGDRRLTQMRLLELLLRRHSRHRPLVLIVVGASRHEPVTPWMLDHLPHLLHDAAVTWLRFAPVPSVSGTVTRLHPREPAAARGQRHLPRRQVERPRFGWESLTETELKVARLIVDGHSNRSAAAALFVSANTVSTHLRSVFTKLDVNTRVQLTRVAMGHMSFADPPRGTTTDT